MPKCSSSEFLYNAFLKNFNLKYAQGIPTYFKYDTFKFYVLTLWKSFFLAPLKFPNQWRRFRGPVVKWYVHLLLWWYLMRRYNYLISMNLRTFFFNSLHKFKCFRGQARPNKCLKQQHSYMWLCFCTFKVKQTVPWTNQHKPLQSCSTGLAIHEVGDVAYGLRPYVQLCF